MFVLAEIVRYWSRSRPHAVSLWFDGTETTWAQLDARTDALAAGISALGLTQGDRIGVMLNNAPTYVDTVVAAWKLGLVIVPINVRNTAEETAFVVADADCSLVVVGAALADTVRDVATRQPVWIAEEMDGHYLDAAPPAVVVAPGEAATICYTSGTTGSPKGAVLTHRGWELSGRAWVTAMGFGQDERILLPFPLAFTGGFAVWVMAYWSGSRLVLEPQFSADRTLELFESQRVTSVLAVPAIYQALVAHPGWESCDVSSWRTASCGGAVVPPALLEQILAKGVPVSQMYSLTESSASGAALPSHDAMRKLGSAGLPMIHHELRVADEEGRPVPVGTVGEIQLRGENVMVGYWNNPEATEAAIYPDGWLRTGDMGTLDDEGYLYVVDRAKDMLISGGLNVYPAEIERVLAELPNVLELAVIGVPDERWGETPAVIAVTDGAPLSGDDVLARCTGHLADYKLPRYLAVRTQALPRSMSGKVLKRELREEYGVRADDLRPIR
jgi:fatty-acyl-CoA synthase